MRSLLAIAVAVPLVTPVPALAYCYTHSRANLWEASGEPIPVYVNWAHPTAGLVNLAYLEAGFDQASAEAYVKGAIAQINEAGAGRTVPPLYFAGWLDVDTTTWTNRPARSIVVHSGGCALAASCGSSIACTSTTADRFRVDLLAGGTRACGGGDMAWTVHPSDVSDHPDLQGTIAHELLHAMGLGHSNDSTCDDDPAWFSRPLSGAGVDVDNAVMAVPGADNSDYSVGWYRLRRRTLQEDDIGGLGWLYGSQPTTPLLYSSTDGTTWTAEAWPPGLPLLSSTTRGNASLSSASDSSADYMIATWGGYLSRASWAVREADGTWSPVRQCSTPGFVDCDTWHTPAAAVLGGRSSAYMVAWTSGDNPDDSPDVLRFEIVDPQTDATLADGTYLWHFDHYSRALGVGANPVAREFIVAALAEYNVLVLQSFDTDGVLTDVRSYSSAPGGRPHHVGNPVCTEAVDDVTMRCLVPLATNDVAGTCAGYLEFEHGTSGFGGTSDLHWDCDVQPAGRPSFAAGFGRSTSFLLAGAQLPEAEAVDLYGLWSITDPYAAVDGAHAVALPPAAADRYRSVGSLQGPFGPVWFVVDGVYLP